MFATFPKFNFVVEENLITIRSLSHHYMILHAARLLIGPIFWKASNLPAGGSLHFKATQKTIKKPMGFYPMGKSHGKSQ